MTLSDSNHERYYDLMEEMEMGQMGEKDKSEPGPAYELAVGTVGAAMAAQFEYMMSDPGAFIRDLGDACRTLAEQAVRGLLEYGDDSPDTGWLVWNGEFHRMDTVNYRLGDAGDGYTLLVTTAPPQPAPDAARLRMMVTVREALFQANTCGDADDLDRIAEAVVDGLLASRPAESSHEGWLIYGEQAHELAEVDAHGVDDGYAAWTLSTIAKGF